MNKAKQVLTVALLVGLTQTISADNYLSSVEHEAMRAGDGATTQTIAMSSGAFTGVDNQQRFEAFISRDYADLYSMYQTLNAQDRSTIFELSTWEGATVDDIYTAVAALYIHTQQTAGATKNS